MGQRRKLGRRWGAGVVLAWALGCGAPQGEVAKVEPGPAAKPSAKPSAERPSRGVIIQGKLPLGARVAKPEGHLAAIKCLSFSPDGSKLLSSGNDGSVLVWDVESGRILKRFEEHQGFVGGCGFFPDGERVASGDAYGRVAVWSLSGKDVQWLRMPRGASIYSLAVRQDGAELLVGTTYGWVLGWALPKGTSSLDKQELGGPSGQTIVWAVGYVRNQPFSAGDTGLKIWGPEKEPVLKTTTASMAVLPHGRMAMGGIREIRLVELSEKHELLDQGPLHDPQEGSGHATGVYGLASNALGDRLVSADRSGQVRLWNLETKSLHCSHKEPAGLRVAAFDSMHGRMAVAGDDASITLLDAKDCQVQQRFSIPRGRVYALAVQEDSLLVGDGTGQVSRFELPSLIQMETEHVHQGEVAALTALPARRWISAGTDLNIFEGPQAKLIGSTDNVPLALAASSEESFALVGDFAGNLQRIASGGGSSVPKLGLPGQIMAIALHPKGKEALIGGVWKSLKRLDLASHTFFPKDWPYSLKVQESTAALRYDSQGKLFAQGGTDGTVLLRNAKDGTVLRELHGLDLHVSALVFPPSGDAHPQDGLLWAGGVDRQLVRWNLNNTKSDLPDRRIQEEAAILNLQATPDGLFLIAGLQDGRVSVHSLPDGELYAHIYPFADGSWATVFAEHDGQPARYYIGSGPVPERDQAAFQLQFELFGEKERRAGLLQDERYHKDQALSISLRRIQDPLSIQASTRRDPSGMAYLSATIFSPSGWPKVLLDGTSEVKAIYPSPTEAMAYQLRLSFDNPKAQSHTLTVSAPDGSLKEEAFALPPDPRIGSAYLKALVLGIEDYGRDVPPALGAKSDASGFARALAGAQGWKLAEGSNLKTITNGLTGKKLKETIQGFFEGAKPEETLLLYFAGHGETLGNDGFLLGSDALPGNANRPETRLSATELWQWIDASKAPYVVVILDSCRAANLLFPQDEAAKAERRKKSVAFLLATNAQQNAGGTVKGGVFTRALIEAMKRKEEADPITGAVTVTDAVRFSMRSDQAKAQAPTLFGTLRSLPLGWPAGPRLPTRSDALALEKIRGGAGSVFSVVEPMVEYYRAMLLDAHKLEGESANRSLRLDMVPTADVEKIVVQIHLPGDKARVLLEHRDEIAAPKNKTKIVHVPLPQDKVPPKQKYQVEIYPCVAKPGGGCLEEAFSFEREL